MNDKDRKRHFAYEALTLLLSLAALAYITRLWPILLLIILGIFVAILRLLFLSSKKVAVTEPLPPERAPVREPTERDVQDMAYSVIQRRITELVLLDFPEARWIWETPQAKIDIREGREVFILLNRAGGYRRAKVHIRDLRVLELEYLSMQPTAEKYEPSKKPGNEPTEPAASDPPAEDYSLLAFEWVEAHIMELNDRCNEAIGLGEAEVLLTADELPVEDSWPDICEALVREELNDLEIVPDGIKIYLHY